MTATASTVLLQNHQIKLLSEEASTSLRAAEHAGQAAGGGDPVAAVVKADPAEKQDEKKAAAPDAPKPGECSNSLTLRICLAWHQFF